MTDGQTDRHTDVHRETIIPRHYCEAGYKNDGNSTMCTQPKTGSSRSFLFYIYFSLSLHYFL